MLLAVGFAAVFVLVVMLGLCWAAAEGDRQLAEHKAADEARRSRR